MNTSLRDLQRRFAASLLDPVTPQASVYRNTIAGNYRNALGATYAVVRQLTGAAFFNAAVDAFTAAHPSAGGDLNVYGREFGAFLAAYPPARTLPYLPDVARLEWAMDEAMRAADREADPEAVLAALAQVAGDLLVRQRLALDPSCRFVHSPFPVMRIWQVHQSDGDKAVDLDAGPDHLVVRREGAVPSIARCGAGDFAFLAALSGGADLGTSLEAAVAIDAWFDLGTALRRYIGDATIAGLG
jgi:Putative DNA-binding domain